MYLKITEISTAEKLSVTFQLIQMYEQLRVSISRLRVRFVALLNQGMNDNLAPIQKLVWV